MVKRRSVDPIYSMCVQPSFIIGTNNEDGAANFVSKEERIELGGLYGVCLPEISIESLYDMIKDKDEITQIALYNKIKGKEPIALIDEALLEYYK